MCDDCLSIQNQQVTVPAFVFVESSMKRAIPQNTRSQADALAKGALHTDLSEALAKHTGYIAVQPAFSHFLYFFSDEPSSSSSVVSAAFFFAYRRISGGQDFTGRERVTTVEGPYVCSN